MISTKAHNTPVPTKNLTRPGTRTIASKVFKATAIPATCSPEIANKCIVPLWINNSCCASLSSCFLPSNIATYRSANRSCPARPMRKLVSNRAAAPAQNRTQAPASLGAPASRPRVNAKFAPSSARNRSKLPASGNLGTGRNKPTAVNSTPRNAGAVPLGHPAENCTCCPTSSRKCASAPTTRATPPARASPGGVAKVRSIRSVKRASRGGSASSSHCVNRVRSCTVRKAPTASTATKTPAQIPPRRAPATQAPPKPAKATPAHTACGQLTKSPCTTPAPQAHATSKPTNGARCERLRGLIDQTPQPNLINE